jgi:hypothetical protein
MWDTLLLSAARIATFDIDKPLTNASGFFFAREERLYLVTSRHVLIDTPSERGSVFQIPFFSPMAPERGRTGAEHSARST